LTRDEFRQMALSYPEAVELAEPEGAVFRVGSKAFASLAPRDPRWAAVMLPPEDARLASAGEPELFAPQRSGWLRQGFTHINLAKCGEYTVRSALDAAWKHVAPRRLAARLK
jgi:hypothetical protein